MSDAVANETDTVARRKWFACGREIDADGKDQSQADEPGG
jgi:hypothetical protein